MHYAKGFPLYAGFAAWDIRNKIVAFVKRLNVIVVVRIDQSQSNILLIFDLIGQFLQLQPLTTTFTTIIE